MSRPSRLALLTVLGTVLAAVSTAPVASAATQRYASPTGSGTDCSSAIPCTIRKAVEGAAGNDEVIVAPGDYSLTTSLITPYPITVHGVAGQPRPRLMFSGAGELGKPQEGLKVMPGSTVRYVETDQAWPTATALFAQQASVDQVIARAAADHWTASIQSSTIRDSIVVASGANGVALQTDSNGASSFSTYRNVTAIASGSGGIAVRAWAIGAAGNAAIQAVNVIARGGSGGHSFVARGESGASAAISVSRSNWNDGFADGTNASFVNAGGNQGAAPVFVNAATGDYRQAAGSPTINAGIDGASNGTVDVDGDPRIIGTTDIGADEFVVAPVATTGPASAVTDQAATLSGMLNAGGAPTTYHFEYGPTAAYGGTTAAASAGSGTGAVAAGATLSSLNSATTYHYRVVATNAGGVTHGSDQTFTTAAAPAGPAGPPSAPPPPPSTPTDSTPTSTTATSTPAPAFAGVTLVSTRLGFAHRLVTLGLRCPAGTAGGCWGQTKLTARYRRAGSPAATTVVLGRATFSIAAGEQAKIKVRVSRAGRRLLSGVRHLRGKDTSAARNGAGQSKTTVAAVTIRRR